MAQMGVCTIKFVYWPDARCKSIFGRLGVARVATWLRVATLGALQCCAGCHGAFCARWSSSMAPPAGPLAGAR
eukprot:11161532-Lingulodinium_polyedra.AAC.1